MRKSAFFIVLSCIGVGLFIPTWFFGLVAYDDPWLIQNNAALRYLTWQEFVGLWTDLSAEFRVRVGAEYLPVRDLSIALDFWLFGSWYPGFHVVNTLLYGVACGLVGCLIQQWTGQARLAWLTGLLFATHPIHVEAVAWLSERKGLLCAVFVLSASLTFHRFVTSRTIRSAVLTALFCVLAVWSKAVGVMTPVWLAAIGWWWSTASPVQRGKVCLGWFGILIVTGAAFVPVWLVGQSVGMVGDRPTPVQGAEIIALLHAHYAKLLALIGPFGIRYPLDRQDPATAQVLLGSAIIVVLLLALGTARTPRTLKVAVATWGIFFAPVSHFLAPLQNLAADRYMLLPGLGWCITLGYGLQTVLDLRLGKALASTLIAVQMLLSAIQTQTWRSTETLFRHALVVDPNHGPAMIQLALVAQTKRDDVAVWQWLDHAEQIPETRSRALMHKGLVLARQHQVQQSLYYLEQAARDPQADKAQANLAQALLRYGQRKSALIWARRAVTLRPLVEHNQRTLGNVALANGYYSEALRAYCKALKLNPDNPQNARNLLRVYDVTDFPAESCP